ncbi:MAG: efflux RND transporter permease subunit [Gammaproteobacteria bacterium]
MTDSNPHNDSAHDGENAGIAGTMAKSFIHSPLSPLLYLAMLALGLLGLIITPRQEDPQISVPMVDIFFSYPGASSEQVAHLAVDPLQRMMSEIPGVKHIYGAAQRDSGMVTVQFKVGEPLGPSIVKVHDKLATNMDKIPPGVSKPLVKRKSIDDVPVVTLTLWSRDVDDGRLRLLALDLLQRLKEIPDTGEGFIVGGRKEQIRIEVSPERLSGFGISLDQVAQTIQTANDEANTGTVETGGRHFSVYSGSFLRTAEDVKRLVVGSHRGSPVYVRDVARVTQRPEDADQLVSYYSGVAYHGDERVDGAPAVTIAIAKKEGANGVEVANALIAKVDDMKGRLIPGNVHVELTRNYGKTANDKVNGLMFKLVIATGAVTILVLFALGMKPAIVVTLVIPVVLLMTVFSAWLIGMTIDRVSLFALIFAIGILVDDAIVVVENIYRRWLLKGDMDTDTAVDAVREVGNPTIIATLTVVAALLPMAAVTGMMGPYMAPIPTLGSVAMIFSLVAAFAFTPYLAMRIKPTLGQLHEAEKKEQKQSEFMERLFNKTLVPMIEQRRKGWLFLFGLIGAFFLSMVLFPTGIVAVKMLPYDNKPEFSVVIDMPEGTALPETANVTTTIAERLRRLPEVTAIQTYVGTAQPFDFNGMVRHYYLRDKPWQAEVHVQLVDKGERDRSSHELALEARELVRDFAGRPGTAITIVEMPPGPPVLQSVVAEVYGPTDYSRRQTTRFLTDIFHETARENGSLADIDNYLQAQYSVWRFEVNTEKAVRRGISVDTINRNLSMAMGGFKLGDVKMGTVLEPTYIVMEVPLAARAQVNQMLDLPIATADGGSVPLGELGSFVQAPQDPVIYFKDLRRVDYVVADVAGDLAAPLYGMLDVEERLKRRPLPDGSHITGTMTGPPEDTGRPAFEWAGEWTVTYETFRDMGIAFAAALVLIYILVVWEFSNFTVPLVIMAPIPLTLIGIVPGHMIMNWIVGAEFTATSMIGFIALAGIIVRNSILLVDFCIHRVREGATVEEAVVQSCTARTRPILITAFALVLGSSVILTDPIFQGMAISLLFGVLVSTVLTLVVIPLGCVSAKRSIMLLAFEQGGDPAGTTGPGGGGPAGGGPRGGGPGGGGRPGMGAKLGEAVVLTGYAVRGLGKLAGSAVGKAISARTAPASKPAPAPASEPQARVAAEPVTGGSAQRPVRTRPQATPVPSGRSPTRTRVETPPKSAPDTTGPAVVADAPAPEPVARREPRVRADAGAVAPVKPLRRRRRIADEDQVATAPTVTVETTNQGATSSHRGAVEDTATKSAPVTKSVGSAQAAKHGTSVAKEGGAVTPPLPKARAVGSRKRRGIRLKDS